MFYDIDKSIIDCINNNNLVFEAIKHNYREVYEKVLDYIDLNITDDTGDNVLMKLLKNKDYDLVREYITRDDLYINHQNNDGDTITHMLVTINYLDVKEILELVFARCDFSPNIKNNLNETILDKSIKNRYLYATIMILKDKRFNNIGLYSFKNLYEVYIKSNEYGLYSKLNNFSMIFDNLKNKKLMPRMDMLINNIKNDEKIIKNDLSYLDVIINKAILETI